MVRLPALFQRAKGLQPMNSLSQHASASLHTALSPRLQRAVRLLQMSSQDFAQVVRDALDSNPFLEQEELPATADSAPMDENPASHPLPRRDLGHGWCEPAASGRCRRGRVRYARGPRLAGGPSAGATQCAGFVAARPGAGVGRGAIARRRWLSAHAPGGSGRVIAHAAGARAAGTADCAAPGPGAGPHGCRRAQRVRMPAIAASGHSRRVGA